MPSMDERAAMRSIAMYYGVPVDLIPEPTVEDVADRLYYEAEIRSLRRKSDAAIAAYEAQKNRRDAPEGVEDVSRGTVETSAT